MLSTERKLYLLQKVEREGTIHVRDVAKQLNISETTIRRDLMELEQEGKVRRVHGGAVSLLRMVNVSFWMEEPVSLP